MQPCKRCICIVEFLGSPVRSGPQKRARRGEFYPKNSQDALRTLRLSLFSAGDDMVLCHPNPNGLHGSRKASAGAKPRPLNDNPEDKEHTGGGRPQPHAPRHLRPLCETPTGGQPANGLSPVSQPKTKCSAVRSVAISVPLPSSMVSNSPPTATTTKPNAVS